MSARISPKILKTIKLAEISLKDFTDKSKNETITKNQLIKFSERSYLTSNTYINEAVKKNYFKTLRNKKDKRSIFILPTEFTIKNFSDYVDKRAWLYKAIK